MDCALNFAVVVTHLTIPGTINSPHYHRVLVTLAFIPAFLVCLFTVSLQCATIPRGAIEGAETAGPVIKPIRKQQQVQSSASPSPWPIVVTWENVEPRENRENERKMRHAHRLHVVAPSASGSLPYSTGYLRMHHHCHSRLPPPPPFGLELTPRQRQITIKKLS